MTGHQWSRRGMTSRGRSPSIMADWGLTTMSDAAQGARVIPKLVAELAAEDNEAPDHVD